MQVEKSIRKKLKISCALFMTATFLSTNFTYMAVVEKDVYANQFVMGVEDHWAEPYMRNLFSRGLMRGDLSGNMNPNKNITRAEFVSIINRAFGYKKQGNTPFKDIKGTEWYAEDIAIAYNQGYFSGNGKNQSDANGYLTREQAVSLLCRNIKLEEISGENFSFLDSRSIENWSRGYVNAATQKGYVSGYEDRTFKPKKYITRGEAAKIFSDAVGEIISQSGTKSLGFKKGNVTITTSGVTLKDTVIQGDLYITEGVGLGHTYLQNVAVLGEVIISGTGESYAGKSSVTFDDSTINKLIVTGADNTKSIKIDGTTVINSTKISSNTYLEEYANRDGGFKDIILDGPENTELHLSGVFDNVIVKGPKSKLFLDNGTIRNLIIDEEAKDSKVYLDDDTYVNQMSIDVGVDVSGKGEIGYVKVNASGSTISMLPDEIEIRPGLTANINGKDITSKDAEESSLNPRILSDYPKIEDIGPTDANAIFRTNKPGRVYWAITRYEDGKVSIDDIIKPDKYDKSIIKNGNLLISSNSDQTVKISGLEKDREYILSAVFIDEKDDESSRKTETFSTLDNSKSGFLSGYPRVKEVNSKSAVVEFVATKDSDVYWAAYPKGNPAPDNKSLKTQKLYGEVDNGIQKKVKKYKGENITISDLDELKSYDFYALISDGLNDSSVIKLQFTTKDSTAPQFNTGFPKLDSTDRSSSEVSVSIDEDAKVYYSVYAGGTPFPIPGENGSAPDINSNEAKQQIISGKGSQRSNKTSNIKANTQSKVKLTGLKPEEDYDIYFVAEDTNGNLSDIKKISIGAKPDFLSNYPKIQSVNNLYAEIAVNVTKDCKAYWAVLPSGSVAPNEYNLKTQIIQGATNKGVGDCKKNTENILNVDKLNEYSEYEFYVLVSDGTNDSKTSKLKFKTSDLTPPIFSNGYPAMDKITDKSIEIKVRVNESGTIHYVLCRKGDEFPVPVPPSAEKPSLDSFEAKNQVVTGNNGYKNGKLSVKENVESKFTISGLNPETPYDLYIVAKDSFNNISNVKYLDVKTLDNTPPTAKLEFEETISGDVIADSEIRIKFSEIVIDNISKQKLSEVEKNKLSQNIALYDVSAIRRPEVSIDFTKAVVENVDGYTLVTFPKGTLDLKSGNTYEFELNRIADTSSNRMDEKYLLPSFNTVAPMVEINETIASKGMDMTFELIPQVSETNDNIFYDIVFESNEKVEFEIYEKIGERPDFDKITGSGIAGRIIVDKGKRITLQNIKGKILSNYDEYKFNKFKDLKKVEYGIKIISINGDTDRKGWSSTVDFNVNCIIGSNSGLSPVADNPTDRLNDAIKEGKVTVVNYPKDFKVRVFFTDTIVPEFEAGYPKLDVGGGIGLSQVGDTLIRPIVKTTRSARFYYLIAKDGTVTDPTPEGIMDGKYKPQEGVYGSFEVTSGKTEFEFRIDGLKPNVNYTMFCFLKGTPAATSPMKVIPFTTVSVAPPKIDSAFIKDRLENSAIVEIALDKEATVDWIVFNKKSMPDFEITGDFIRKREENIAYKPIDFGTSNAKISSGSSLAKTTITINNIERDVYYNFYGVAKSPSGGGDSKIISIENITPADKTKPQVIVSTVIKNYGSSYAEQPYKGEVTLTFSEPMYYIVNEGDPLIPLDINAFKDGLEWGDFSVDIPGSTTRVSIESFKTQRTDTGDRALKSVTLTFSDVYNNSTINYKYLLSDKNTNIAGSLNLQFVDMELEGENRAKSYWKHEFINGGL